MALPLRTVTNKCVAIVLACHSDKNGESWPTTTTLAAECNLSLRAVRNALTFLESNHLLTRHLHPGKGSTYELTPASCALQPRHHVPQTPAPPAPTPAPRAGPHAPHAGVQPPPSLYEAPPLEKYPRSTQGSTPKNGNPSGWHLIKSFSDRFPHYRISDPKQNKRELESAKALLAVVSEDEVLALADAALKDRFAGTRRSASNLQQLAIHLPELRAQFPNAAPKPSEPTPEWAKGDKTPEEVQADWAEYLASCSAANRQPDMTLKHRCCS